MITQAQANAITALAEQKGISNAAAAAELGIDLGVTGTASENADPWAKFAKADSRIPMEKLADTLRREGGLSELEALQKAIHMNQNEPEAAAPLIAEETSRFEAEASRRAQQEWANTSEGIAAMGRLRTAQANAIATKAAEMRPELEARGLPPMTDDEVVTWVADMERKRAADAEAASLDANLAHIAAGEGEGA